MATTTRVTATAIDCMLKTRQREEQEREQQQEYEQQQQRRRQWQRSSQHAMQLCSVCVQVRVCVCLCVSWKSTPCQGCKGKKSEEWRGREEFQQGVRVSEQQQRLLTVIAHTLSPYPSLTNSLSVVALSLCMTSLCFNANMRLLIIIKTTTKRSQRERKQKQPPQRLTAFVVSAFQIT